MDYRSAKYDDRPSLSLVIGALAAILVAMVLLCATLAAAEPTFMGYLLTDGGSVNNVTPVDAGAATAGGEFTLPGRGVASSQGYIDILCSSAVYVCADARQTCTSTVGEPLAASVLFTTQTAPPQYVAGARAVSADGGWTCTGRSNPLSDGGCVAAPITSSLVSVIPQVDNTATRCTVWRLDGMGP